MTFASFSFKPNQFLKPSVEQRIAAFAELIAELRELEQLRERVREATLMATRSRPRTALVPASRSHTGLSRPRKRPAEAERGSRKR
jgi:hypothetical protein